MAQVQTPRSPAIQLKDPAIHPQGLAIRAEHPPIQAQGPASSRSVPGSGSEPVHRSEPCSPPRPSPRPAPGSRLAWRSLASPGRLGALWLAGCLLVARPVFAQKSEVSPEVLQAIRLLLSDEPKEEARGAEALKRLGPAAAPQIRYWLGKVRSEVDRVQAVLAEIEGKTPAAPGLELLTAGEFFSKKLAECRSLIRKGEYSQAVALAEAILVLDRASPGSWELRRLVRRAKESIVSSQVLEPSVDSDKLVYELGEKPEVMFRLSNRDSRVARIRVEKGVLGEVSMTVTRQFVDGSMKREERRLRIQVPPDVDQILIGPGLTWEHPLGFEGAEDLPASGVVVRAQVAGRFRPTRWNVARDGEESRDENITLPMNTAEFWIVPRGESTLCERPLEKLTAALIFSKLEPFFVGGQISVWVGEEDANFNESLVETLVGSLGELDLPRLEVAGRFLAQATGHEFGADAKKWRAWWKKRAGERKGAQGAPGAKKEPAPAK